MATKKRKKKKWTVRFELGPGGMLTLVSVSCCIFLWMFLLGIWAGQTVLQGVSGIRSGTAPHPAGRPATTRRQPALLQESAKQPVAESGTVDNDAEPEMAEDSFFALQVGAFANRKLAIQRVLAWRIRDQKAYFTEPGGRESRYRVFIGRYDTLERANSQARTIQQQTDDQVYITLLQESEVREP